MMSARSEGRSPKASSYISQLYEARCHSRWLDVPELARKTEKHAPERKCLAIASRVGAAIAANPQRIDYEFFDKQYGTSLAAAVVNEGDTYGSKLDGTVHRCFILRGLKQDLSVLEFLPEAPHRGMAPVEGSGAEAWNSVVILQGTLVRGLALEALGRQDETVENYRSAISYISQVMNLSSSTPELCRATEELLTHMCWYFSVENKEKPARLGEAMATYHLLKQFINDQGSKPLSLSGILTQHTPRSVWRAIYNVLSTIIQEGLVYHPSPIYRDHETVEHRGLLDQDDFVVSRVQQRADLRRVESNYESLLLKETLFPRAGETNKEVEMWVDLVMNNWKFLCGPSWSDEELGPGGKVGVGRSTLDILYRAATKTFHSTQILRHLFTVHCFLSEFDLGLRAFDTYVQIMTKGRERAEKKGEINPSIDDDDAGMQLASEAIRVCCRYAGSDDNVRKALNISKTLEHWIANGKPKLPATVPLAHRALGIAQATWARRSHRSKERAEQRQKAELNLRKSISECPSTLSPTESLYALALLLAENRDLQGAVETVKTALNQFQEAAEQSKTTAGVRGSAIQDVDLELEPARSLPLWHLLGLLLITYEDYSSAGGVFDAALERAGVSGATSERVYETRELEAETSDTTSKWGIFEKQTALEILMTKTTLIEAVSGPEAAVNASSELLTEYFKLFGNNDDTKAQALDNPQPQGNLEKIPPKSSSGTVKGSFLTRKKADRHTLHKPIVTSKQSSTMVSPWGSRPPTATVGPTHRATGHETDEKNGALHMPWHHTDRPSGQSSRNNSLRKNPLGSLKGGHRREKSQTRPPADGTPIADTIPETYEEHSRDDENGGYALTEKESAGQPLPSVPHNQPFREEPAPPGHLDQPLEQDTRLPVPLPRFHNIPIPQTPARETRKRKLTILIKLWLFISRLYTNANMYEDSRAAIEEADALIVKLQIDIVEEHGSSVRSFQASNWNYAKSVEDLCADVYAERGLLLKAQMKPHEAKEQFEMSLFHSPDHAEATVGLCNVLLDIYCQITPPERPESGLGSLVQQNNSAPLSQQDSIAERHEPSTHLTHTSMLNPADPPQIFPRAANHANVSPATKKDPEPPELNRLTARDRAYGLLSSLTKLGHGWSCSEAWFELARAYEESGLPAKAREALWWVVELEDARPIRNWREVAPGGYVL